MLLKNRYRIEKKLGQGGFGIVYLACDEELLSKRVVVKILNVTDPDQWFLKKFQQEKEALARINHPGVVELLDAGSTPEGAPFLVMQFVDGKTLREVIGPRGIERTRALEIARQIGDALSAAHEKGVSHRDLKPENIMLQSGGGLEFAKLIDFGVAGVMNSLFAGGETKIAGSYRYMAPEQFRGQPCPQSDIYAFALICAEMITGNTPVESAEQAVVLQGQPLSDRLAQLGPAAGVIAKGMAQDPGQRYQRASEFVTSLAASLSAAQAASTPGPPPRHEGLEMGHVLFMDLVSYSLMSIERQTECLSQLQQIVRAASHFDSAIRLPTGDGMALVFFGDPAVAAESAFEIAAAIKKSPGLRLRMGLHTGLVERVSDINASRNVSGGGINVAQRVMDCGDAGHILVSSNLVDVLSDSERWKPYFQDLGEHRVKHGVRIHLYNFHNDEIGKRDKPSKLRRFNPWSIRALYIIAALIAAAGIWWLASARAPQQSLAYSITVKGPREPQPFQLAGEIIFQPGYQIALNLSSPQPGYLYALNEGPLPDGRLTFNLLYPTPGRSPQLQANTTARIPAEPNWIEFDTAAGVEKLYLVWAAKPVPQLEQARANAPIEHNTYVIGDQSRFLAAHLIAKSQVDKNEDAKLTTLRAKGDVLAHLIRLEHH